MSRRDQRPRRPGRTDPRDQRRPSRPGLTLGLAYDLGLGGAATLSLLIVLLGGEMPRLSWLSLLVPPGALILRRRGIQPPGAAGTGLGLVGLFSGAGVLAQRGVEALALAAGVSLVGILCGRLVTGRSLRHDMQALLLSLLLVFAGTVLHTQVTYAVVFVAYAVVAVWALLARQLVAGAGREAARAGGTPLATTLARRDVVTPSFLAATAALALALLSSTIVLFVVFPRVGLGSFGLLRRAGGRLPGEVSLVDSPRAGLGSGDAVVRLRGVPYAAFERGLYLRGPVYGKLTRSGFSRLGTEPALPGVLGKLGGSGTTRKYQVFLQPITGRSLLALGQVREAHILAGGGRGLFHRAHIVGKSSQGELRLAEPLAAAARYLVEGTIAAPESGPMAASAGDSAGRRDARLRTYLELPSELDPRIPELARAVGAGASGPAAKARRIRSYLHENFTYTLDNDNAQAPDPLVRFLLKSRRGHCEYFATAFAVMLRAVGVPARVVGGFQGGTWDDEGGVAVFTMANAHAWVEWFLPGRGWMVDDATPARDAPRQRFAGIGALIERLRRSWDDYVVEYSLLHQVALWNDLERALRPEGVTVPIDARRWRRPGLALGAGAILALALWLAWRRLARRLRRVQGESRRPPPLARALSAAVARLQGTPVAPATTLREAVTSCEGPPVLREALEVYERQRFAGRAPSARRVRNLLRELASLRRDRR